jgi:FlaA1/EpsC-like NDP-sugar epimerase
VALDLLGRRETELDLDAIAAAVQGRRILVTGAGGSIGSELCRQLDRFRPAELLLMDHDETSLQAVKLSLDGRARLDSTDLLLRDIRHGAAVDAIIRERRPDIVFHVAALKHVPLLESNPGEAFATNVIGTLNLLRASAKYRVRRFVNVSTDKAADPISVLGYTKRIGERLTAWFGAQCETGVFLSVRFGNVLASRGSVLDVFASQIASGGPLTVTHPEATRFFMTREEAVHLMLQASTLGQDGEALVLDMGNRIRINDLAMRLSRAAPWPVPIVYTGLRPGEKLHETLLSEDEVAARARHPLVWHVEVPPLPPSHVRTCALAPGSSALISALRSLAYGMATDAAEHREPLRAGRTIDL